MPEARPETVREIPRHLGAVFAESIVRPSVHDYVTGKDVVPVLDIRIPRDRKVWALENIRVFSDGTLSRPEARWKQVVDEWLTDLKTSATKLCVNEADREGAAELELEIKAMMAVSSSARAMEPSGGSHEAYATMITQGSEGPDLSKQDSWQDFLLHKDSEKLARVVNNPLVRFFYIKLLRDSGFNVPDWWEKDKNLTYNDIDGHNNKGHKTDISLDLGTARKSVLAEYLKEKADKGGFNSYIAHVFSKDKEAEAFILEQFEDNIDTTSIWAAAKLACDAFLVDKFTRWEYEVTEGARAVYDDTWKDDYELYPFPGWGGDPLRAVLRMSFLPGIIKGVYTKGDKAILQIIDEAFRPTDVFNGKIIKPERAIPVSMVGHLKHYFRLMDAGGRLLGGSRAQGVAQWTSRTQQEDLPYMTEKIDEVYGTRESKNGEPDGIWKHVAGIMTSRILLAKSLAAAVESAKPGFKDDMRILFDPKAENRPFLEIIQFLWGPDIDARRGFIAALAGGRTRFVFKDNVFGAEAVLKDAWDILALNDQDPKSRGRAKTLNTIGFIVDAIQAIARGGAGQRR